MRRDRTDLSRDSFVSRRTHLFVSVYQRDDSWIMCLDVWFCVCVVVR